MSRSSPFRFVAGTKSGHYSVWRGDLHVGYVTKNVYRITDRGVTRTSHTWTPSLFGGPDLPSEKTRDAAAIALWRDRQRTS